MFHIKEDYHGTDTQLRLLVGNNLEHQKELFMVLKTSRKRSIVSVMMASGESSKNTTSTTG